MNSPIHDNHLVTSSPINRINSLRLTNNKNYPLEDRIVFIDLDLTLFDYTTARENGAKLALKELDLDISVDAAFSFYSRMVDLWHSFDLIGLPNLRRFWNIEVIYYLVIFFTSTEYTKESYKLFELLESMNYSETDDLNSLVISENAKTIEFFTETIEKLRSDNKLQQDVRRALLRFEEATEKLDPFNNVRDMITALRNQKGYHIFVVSEGDLGIQWEKIKKLGLDDLITSSNLIVTDGLASPLAILKSIKFAENKILTNLEKNDKDQRLLLELEALRFFEQQLRLFQYKRDGLFFAQALHVAVQVIMGTYDNQDFANVPIKTWNELRPIKLATLGDRYSNDIKPLMNLYSPEQLLSVRMRYGKYMNEKVGVDDPEPDFTIKEIADARNILLSDSNWINKAPISRPNRFHTKTNQYNNVLALVGLSMNKPISTIAESMLQDAGFSQDHIITITEYVRLAFENPFSNQSLEKTLRSLLNNTNLINEDYSSIGG